MFYRKRSVDSGHGLKAEMTGIEPHLMTEVGVSADDIIASIVF